MSFLNLFRVKNKTENEPIILNAYTYDSRFIDFCAIDKSQKNLPLWWNKTPNMSEDSAATVKHCRGFHLLYKNSLTLPAWSAIDLYINNAGNTDGSNVFIDESVNTTPIDSKLVTEGVKQFTKNDSVAIQMGSPWKLKCDEEINFLMHQPVWQDREMTDNFTLFPGILDFKYQHDLQLQMHTKLLDQKRKVSITPPMALAMLTPLTERKVIVKHHLVTKNEWSNIGSFYEFVSKNVEPKQNYVTNSRLYTIKKMFIQRKNEYAKNKD